MDKLEFTEQFSYITSSVKLLHVDIEMLKFPLGLGIPLFL